MKIVHKLCISTILATILLTGCAAKKEVVEEKVPTPDDFEPVYVTNEEELEENSYYIARNVTEYKVDKNGETVLDENGNPIEIKYVKFFPLLQAEKTYDEEYKTKAGYDFSRVVWVNYSKDEGLIPTMYEGDKLIYKSSTYIPTKYALEKFFDNGYTLGVCGLTQDLSGNFRYISGANGGTSHVLSISDAAGFEGLSESAESIYLVSCTDASGNDYRVTPANMSMSGTVTGLDLLGVYDCDVRTGTEKIDAKLTCNVHYFSSAETYMFGRFTFITPIIAELHIPEYVTNGYYEINGAGLFRYAVNDGITDWHQLTPENSNATIYMYNEECKVVGTTLGLVFDENGFLKEAVASDKTDASNIHSATQTYEQLLDVLTNGVTVTRPTSLTKDGNYYYDDYTVDIITRKEASGSYTLYEFTATSDTETVDFYYRARPSDEVPVVGQKYQVIFKDPTVGSIKSYIVTSFYKAKSEE